MYGKNVQGETWQPRPGRSNLVQCDFFVSPCRREMHTSDLGREWFLPDFFERYGAGFATRTLRSLLYRVEVELLWWTWIVKKWTTFEAHRFWGNWGKFESFTREWSFLRKAKNVFWRNPKIFFMKQNWDRQTLVLINACQWMDSSNERIQWNSRSKSRLNGQVLG
jgi:hypothetical protein